MTTNYTGRTAIISGGAGGIGFAIAHELGRNGMNIVLADIDPVTLEQAAKTLTQDNIKVLACQLDVTLYEQWESTVAKAIEMFGTVDMLVNNAGVGGIPGKIEDTNHETWRWVMDVNLMGVVYGTQAVTPVIKQQGKGGWIINVASMAGMGGVPYAGAYTASKAAVVAMSESWAIELKPFDIHVSALCPAFVKTRIHESYRNRQPQYKTLKPKNVDKAQLKKGMDKATEMVEGGIDPAILARRVVEALNNGQEYIFTHPNYRPVVDYRTKAIEAAFEDAKNSEHVCHLLGEKITMI
jgi:NAD(P)-dependent dehydrogenase (short-subunit alcohol dehydrogenase family)